ncbi:tetratricopeptide repeat protein [Sphingomonas piscis]|uniref:Tetratricopeptide repeat protein n=1 Tax=Sphingomonas piscis TaxID=2714943 RepID=A0A6G7YR32_9SPHN|nr:tetratricopeptide repeat protein [Sphingomonas piscis]QIK79208.1 tetratricopeptide repeat protein [Sphingomonas piscis]
MALAPDSGDSFLREVEENLKRDQARDFARKNLPWLIALVVIFLLAAGGYLFWQHRQNEHASAQSEQLVGIFRKVGTPTEAAAKSELGSLAADSDGAMRATARLTRAALALNGNDRAAAIAEYGQVAADDDVPEAYRDLATIRKTSLEFDTLKPYQVIARLQPYAKAGNPWFGTAGELTAAALIKQGKKAEAGRMYAAIAADPEVPAALRSRAGQLAGTLGVDASASIQLLNPQGR